MCRKCGMISLLRCSVVWWMVQLILTGDIVISCEGGLVLRVGVSA